MFIVEGADYAGKTTLLERVQRTVIQRRWPRLYGTRIREIQHWGMLEPSFDYGTSYLNACGEEQLCDRFVLSELAYGNAYRGGPNVLFTPHRRRLIARELNREGSVTVLVRASLAITRERMKHRDDAFVKTKEDWHTLTHQYNEALDDLALGRRGGSFLGHLDTPRKIDNDALDDAVDFYLSIWKKNLERRGEILMTAYESWGYLWPKIVLVGERVGGDLSGTRPFAGLSDHGSSGTLSKLLDLAGIGEKELYLLNAYRHDGEPINADVIGMLNPRVVIGLGKEAQQFLYARKIVHKEFPHPQWLRRFESKRLDKWAAELKELVSE